MVASRGLAPDSFRFLSVENLKPTLEILNSNVRCYVFFQDLETYNYWEWNAETSHRWLYSVSYMYRILSLRTQKPHTAAWAERWIVLF